MSKNKIYWNSPCLLNDLLTRIEIPDKIQMDTNE